MVRTVGSSGWPGPVRRPLLVHAALLVAFALLWTLIGDPRPATSGAVLVAAVAALSAGIQGAVFLGLEAYEAAGGRTSGFSIASSPRS